MNIAAIVAAAAFITGFGAAWQVQGGRITSLKLEHSDAIISQQRAARATYERYSAAASKAQNDAQVRRTAINSAVDSNGAGLIGLRLTASTVRASATTDAARDAYSDTVTELFDQCGGLLVKIAGDADGIASDNQTLRDAWPK